MSGYQLTAAADADLDEVWRYVAQATSVSAADILEAELHAAMHMLAAMPGIGRLREDLGAEPLRFWAVHKLLIVYRAETSPVQIVRVIHGSRDVAAILGSDPCP